MNTESLSVFIFLDKTYLIVTSSYRIIEAPKIDTQNITNGRQGIDVVFLP